MEKRRNMDNVVNWGFNRAADKDNGSDFPRKDIIDW